MAPSPPPRPGSKRWRSPGKARPRGVRPASLVLLLCIASLALETPARGVAGFVRPMPTMRSVPPRTNRGDCGIGRLCLSSDGGGDAVRRRRERGGDGVGETAEPPALESASSPSVETRRQFFHQQVVAAALAPSIAQAADDNGYFSLRNNNNVPPYALSQQLAKERKLAQQERADKRKKAVSLGKPKKWVPFSDVQRWRSVETCLLEMLPVKNPVFRRLQELVQNLEVLPAGDAEGWKQTLLDAVAILNFLDSKRSILEPVFNQDDPTELYITKSSLGERNIESLRYRLEDLVAIASGDIDVSVDGGGRATVSSSDGAGGVIKRRGRKVEDNLMDDVENIDMEEAGDIDVDAFVEAKRQALLALAELGELLVPSFPYAVPNRGKFGYLPRLLGRCYVTLSFERPLSRASSFGEAFGFNLGGIGGGDKKFLGNVTIVADGYAAPITAGNFVDLSQRQFYTGLSVRAMRKRLGVVPTSSDNVIVNDLTELRDEIRDDLGSAAGARGIFSPAGRYDDPFAESAYDASRATADVVLPILGSFQEGFYDPLTAKPRRIPLEVVTFDERSPTRSTLTYSSTYATLDGDATDGGAGTSVTYSALTSSTSSQRSFSSSTSVASSNSTAAAFSNLDPVLSFNIPGLVALNHPDRISNGGSSEFFALPRGNPKQAKVLDGQYAPFGYVVEGSDVYQSLRPGDVICATYVSETGLLNLVKIRKNAFEGGEDDEVKSDG